MQFATAIDTQFIARRSFPPPSTGRLSKNRLDIKFIFTKGERVVNVVLYQVDAINEDWKVLKVSGPFTKEAVREVSYQSLISGFDPQADITAKTLARNAEFSFQILDAQVTRATKDDKLKQRFVEALFAHNIVALTRILNGQD